jgi:hypothetical protein
MLSNTLHAAFAHERIVHRMNAPFAGAGPSVRKRASSTAPDRVTGQACSRESHLGALITLHWRGDCSGVVDYFWRK